MNERLDARDTASPEWDRILDAHATACPACRVIAGQYQTLRQAVAALGPAPVPPVGFINRVLESDGLARSAAARRYRIGPALCVFAVAASLFVVGLLALRPNPAGPAKRHSTGPQVTETIDPQTLTEALARAGTETWDLARETSAPAARLGREMLGAAKLSNTSATLALSVPESPAADVLQSVGDRVNAGVRPLSGTARHAFGFLFSPPSHDPKVEPPAAHGA